jgi:hypothetical protein
LACKLIGALEELAFWRTKSERAVGMAQLQSTPEKVAHVGERWFATSLGKAFAWLTFVH